MWFNSVFIEHLPLENTVLDLEVLNFREGNGVRKLQGKEKQAQDFPFR